MIERLQMFPIWLGLYSYLKSFLTLANLFTLVILLYQAREQAELRQEIDLQIRRGQRGWKDTSPQQQQQRAQRQPEGGLISPRGGSEDLGSGTGSTRGDDGTDDKEEYIIPPGWELPGTASARGSDPLELHMAESRG